MQLYPNFVALASEAANKIDAIVELIIGNAGQTNLLALNAEPAKGLAWHECMYNQHYLSPHSKTTNRPIGCLFFIFNLRELCWEICRDSYRARGLSFYS